MAHYVYIATSLDGYIARKDGSIDWLMDIPNPADSDYGFSDFIERIDGIVMGRNTFQTVVGFDEWPYSKRVFVLSRTLRHVPDHLSERVEIMSGEANEITDTLRSRGFNNLYIDGGKTIQGFLRKDMIDELIITRIPVVLGSGIPLFAESGLELKFDHVRSEVYENQLVKSWYVRRR